MCKAQNQWLHPTEDPAFYSTKEISMNHPGTICKQGSHQASQRFYSAPLPSTAISYLCLGELHQVGLSECVKCLYSPSSLSVFAGTDCSTHQSIRDQHSPDFLCTTNMSQLSALGESGDGWAELLSSPFVHFCCRSAAKPVAEVQGSLLAGAAPLPHLSLVFLSPVPFPAAFL